MTQPPIGPDLASVDRNKNINWTSVKGVGGQFTILRAVFGRSVTPNSDAPYIDPTWADEAPRARAAGLKVTAYLFVCVPKTGVHTPEPEVQAQAYCDAVILKPGVDLMPCFDIEEDSDILNASQYFDWIVRVARVIEKHYGTKPMMYTSERFWHEVLKDHPAGELDDNPLWLAKPWPWPVKTQVHLDGAPLYSPIYIPQFGKRAQLYQYAGDAIGWPGFSSTVDCNRYETVRPGDKGGNVKFVQCRIGATPDGLYGPATEVKVKEFQTANGLTADGIIGLLTFTKLCWVLPS